MDTSSFICVLLDSELECIAYFPIDYLYVLLGLWFLMMVYLLILRMLR